MSYDKFATRRMQMEGKDKQGEHDLPIDGIIASAQETAAYCLAFYDALLGTEELPSPFAHRDIVRLLASTLSR